VFCLFEGVEDVFKRGDLLKPDAPLVLAEASSAVFYFRFDW